MYLYENVDWPRFTWDAVLITDILGRVRYGQGKLLGQMESIGFELQQEAILKTITQDVLKTSQIEGETLNTNQVRSSVARKLGLEVAGMVPASRDIEGVVEMMLDATQQYQKPITQERLFGWHASLFPSGRSGMHKIHPGQWRKDLSGPMQVVSGPLGREKVHFQAPAADKIAEEMARFIHWFNHENAMDAVLKAALAHLWFITIHPFEDGNGRIARAITDLQLARADATDKRFYSMSGQIEQERKEYYLILEQTQKGNINITPWLTWFLHCLQQAIETSHKILNETLRKADFWQKHQTIPFNDRQKFMINKLWDNFFGNLTSSKWAKITHCSQDTASRDIYDLIEKGVLRKASGGGRSTSYLLNS